MEDQETKERNAEGALAKAERQDLQVQLQGSEWASFFTARVASASAFVRILRKGVFRIPLESELVSVASIVVSRKAGFPRLLSLLQAVGQERDSVRDSVVKLAELAMRQDGRLAALEGTQEASYLEVAQQWLSEIPKKRLPSEQRDAFLTFILWGWRKGVLKDAEVSTH